MPMPPEVGAGPTPDVPNLDPNDPVARLMLRRMQEEGGGASVPQPANNQPAEQPATEPSEPNAAGTPPANDNQNPPPEPPQP